MLRRILKTTARNLVEVQYRKNLLGSIAAGASGFNAHYANVLAAFFVATGQDVAHVVGGSMGVTCMDADGNGSYESLVATDVTDVNGKYLFPNLPDGDYQVVLNTADPA